MSWAISNAASSLRNGMNPIAEFLTRVAPPPACCVAILALREQALFLGITAALGPRLVQELVQKWVVGVLGLCVGAYISWCVLRAWYANEPELDSPAIRLTLLLPGGVSSRTKGLLRSLLVGAQTRAVKLMAMNFVGRHSAPLLSQSRLMVHPRDSGLAIARNVARFFAPRQASDPGPPCDGSGRSLDDLRWGGSFGLTGRVHRAGSASVVVLRGPSPGEVAVVLACGRRCWPVHRSLILAGHREARARNKGRT